MHFIFLLLMLWLAPMQQADAQGLDLGDAKVHVLDQGELSYLRDSSTQLTLGDIRAAHAEGQFNPLAANLGLGYIPDAVWLHLSIKQEHPAARWLEVMPPYLDNIRLFHIRPDGHIDERHAGDHLPQSVKEEPYRSHLFKLDFQPGDHTIFIRLQTSSTVVAMVKLWHPQAFMQDQRSSYFGFGLYFSMILTVLLFNAANWIVSRRAIFLVYIGYLLINGIQWLGINGFLSEFFLPERPDLANLALGLSISLGAAMAWLFFMMILELKRYHPFLYRFSQFGVAISLTTFVATLLGHYQIFMTILLLTGAVSLLTVPWPMWRLWKTGEVWAHLLALAYLIYASLLLINILSSLAILPFNEWGIRAGMVSNIAHILFLHFAFLLHFRRIEAKHAEALQKIELGRSFRKELGQLLTMLTHELKTPLATVRLNLDAMPPIARYEKHQQRIDRALESINGIIDRCAQVDRFDQGQLQDQQVSISLSHWLADQLAQIEHLGRLQLNLVEPLPKMRTDPELLSIALCNLIDNALKYAPALAPVRLQVCEQALEQGSERRAVCFRVSNSLGPGAELPKGEQIFSKYYRGVKDQAQSGSGLGLYLAKGISEKLGGQLRFRTEQNEVEFELCLPLTPD